MSPNQIMDWDTLFVAGRVNFVVSPAVTEMASSRDQTRRRLYRFIPGFFKANIIWSGQKGDAGRIRPILTYPPRR